MAKSNNKIKTTAELAKALEVSGLTIYHLRKIDGLEKGKDGFYDLGEARRLLEIRQARGKAGGKKAEGQRQWETEFRKYRAMMAKAEYEEGQLELVRRSEVELEQVERELQFKRALMGMPKIIATRVLGKGVIEIEAIATELCHEALRKLAREPIKGKRLMDEH